MGGRVGTSRARNSGVSWRHNFRGRLRANGEAHIAHPTRLSDGQASQIILKLTGVADVPKEFALEQNYPNPFNPSTVIHYSLPVNGYVTLKVYNVLGEEVVTLVNGAQDAGYKSVEWNSANVASGVYFYRIEATSISNPKDTFVKVRKMMLIR